MHVFPSLDSEDFNTFLKHSPVYFVMAHDGALPTEGRQVEEGAREKTAKVLLRGILASFNARNFNVALINQNEIRDSKVCHSVEPRIFRKQADEHRSSP